RNGFTAKINLPKKNLVFFSIPYDKGFTATVNGKKVPVEKVSAGMMAVECDKGDNDIRFVYTPMGVKLGNILSIIGVCGLVIYILISQNYKRILKQKAKKQNAES
ncbi:MAG: YfhO family protein, partial [Oscillospiraceae bacterium]